MRHYDTYVDRRTGEAPPPRTASPEIGDKLRFVPSAFVGIGGEGKEGKMTPDGLAPVEVTGTIIEINEAHRWYRVRFEAFEYVMFECFKY